MLVQCLCCGGWPLARAVVLEATAGGFRIKVVREVSAAPAISYHQFLAVHEWRGPTHTYFGRAAPVPVRTGSGPVPAVSG